MPPEANVAKLKAEGGLVRKVENAWTGLASAENVPYTWWFHLC